MSIFGAGFVADIADQGLLPSFALLEIRELAPVPSASASALLGGATQAIDAGGGTWRIGNGSIARIVAVYRFPLAPTYARTELEPSVAITRTQGGTTREHSGPRVRRISFSGQVGLVTRLGTDADGNLRYLPSRQLFEELRKFLDKYLLLASHSPLSDGQPGSEYELVLRYFDRDLHYVVEPKMFAALQDERVRTTFRYELNFETIEEAKSLRARNWLDNVTEAGGSILELMNRSAETFGILAGLAEGFTAALAGVAAAIERPLLTLTAAMGTLLDARNNLDAVYALPTNMVLDATRAMDALGLAFGDAQSGMTEAERENAAPQLAPAIIALDDLRTSTVALVVALRQPRGTTLGARPTAYRTHTVRAGEDLAGIALSRLGDETRAGEIANLNRLHPPYLSVTGLPGTAMPGDVLVLPSDASLSAGTSPGASPGSDAALFGTDLRLQAGDLVAVRRGSEGFDDWALRSGTDNVVDALQRRSETPLGANRIFPLLGIPPLIGEPNDRIGPWLLAYLVEQLERDDRVRRVEKPLLTDSGDGASVELTAVLVDGRSAPVTAG